MVQRNNKDSSGGSGESVRRSEENVRGVGENAQGVWESAQGVRESAQGVWDSAQGVRESAQGVRESVQGVRESAQGVWESAQGVRESVQGVRERSQGVRESSQGVRESSQGVRESSQGVRESSQGVRESSQGVRESSQGVRESSQGVRESSQGVRESSQGVRESAQGDWESAQGVWESAQGVWESVQGVRESVQGVRESAQGVGESVQGVWESAQGVRESVHGVGESVQRGEENPHGVRGSLQSTEKEISRLRRSAQFVRSLWMKWLRQLHNCPEILEAATSIAFLTFISAVVLNDASPEAVYIKQDLATRIISQHLSPNSTKSFVNIASVEDFWMFAQGPLLHGLFPQDTRSSVTHLAGRVRFRQARVDNISCPTTPWLPHVSSSSALSHSQPCYPVYSSLTSSTKPFGFGNGTAWTIVQEEGPAHSGLLTHYSPGGYWLDLPMGLSVAGQALKHLHQEVWLDAASRAVMVDAAVFGPPLWVAGAFHLLVEFPAVGGALSSWELQPVKVNSGTWSASWSLSLACLLLLLQLVNQGRACRSHGWSHMTCPSTWIDLTVIIVCCLVLGFGAHDAFNLRPSLFSAIPSPSSFVDLYPAAAWQIHITYLSSSLLLVSWLQGMRYLALCSAWRPLYLALSRAVPHLLATSMLAIFTFLCFAQLSFLMFSTQLPEFSSFFRCMVSQMQLLMGDKDLNKMVQNSCSVFLLCLLLFFFFIILMNLFFAVLCESYGTVRANMAARQSDSQISAFLKKV
uniref:Polycystin cation channel PKD1/PKD2 domain-containing protein n=1 Tax=Eptatretus burgeri TaxID=7764 RepID=A0A8C4PZG6_EPTBU